MQESIHVRFDPGERQLRTKVIVRESDSGRVVYLVLAERDGSYEISLCVQRHEQLQEILQAVREALASFPREQG